MVASTFQILKPDGSMPFEEMRRRIEAQRTSLMQSVVCDAASLLQGASAFFRGAYPLETPYSPNGEVRCLPWFDEYHSTDPNGVLHSGWRNIALEVRALSLPLLNVASCDHWPEVCITFNVVPEADRKRTLQSLAVEVMFSVDAVLARLPHDPEGAMPWLTLAFKCIVESTLQAQLILAEATSPHPASRATVVTLPGGSSP
jgi:hypothetical protein